MSKTLKNPYELVLGWGGALSIVVGIIMGSAAQGAYDQEVRATEMANSLLNGFAAPDGAALAWVALGSQLVELGVLVLVGLLFYFAVRWNGPWETATPSPKVPEEAASN